MNRRRKDINKNMKAGRRIEQCSKAANPYTKIKKEV